MAMIPVRLCTPAAALLILLATGCDGGSLPLAAVHGKVRVDDALVGEAELFFAHLDQSRSQQMFGDQNFVFSGELKYVLGLAKAAARRQDPKVTV